MHILIKGQTNTALLPLLLSPPRTSQLPPHTLPLYHTSVPCCLPPTLQSLLDIPFSSSSSNTIILPQEPCGEYPPTPPLHPSHHPTPHRTAPSSRRNCELLRPRALQWHSSEQRSRKHPFDKRNACKIGFQVLIGMQRNFWLHQLPCREGQEVHSQHPHQW